MNVTYLISSREQHSDHWSRPMGRRVVSCIKKARSQATGRGPGGHLTTIRNQLGVINTRTAAAIDAYQGTSTIQIAIATDKG